MMQVVVRPAAALDVEEAFLWYDRQRAGLGDEFLAAVQSALDDVVTQPARYAVVRGVIQGDGDPEREG